MLNQEAFREFREGLGLLRDGETGAAAQLLQQAFKMDPENSYYMSYYGLSLGLAQGMWAEAERLCHTAVCRGRRQAQLYLNLAELYEASGRRQAASDTLARGLHYLPHDGRLQIHYGQLTVRRPAVLPFLARTHFLNRQLGSMRSVLVRHVPRRKWLAARESHA